MSSHATTLSSREIVMGCVAASVIQVGFFALLVLAGATDAHIKAVEEKLPEARPIAVKPVVDELPLLKLGSKQDKKPKLPDMWKKQAPTPVKRYEESSAPSTKAEDSPAAIPTSKLTDKDKEPPPPDAEVVKEIDQQLKDEETKEAPQMQQEGHADGSAEGTETDPLKARAVDLYRSKILSWFNARFRPPVDQIPCGELKDLAASVSVQVGADRTVAGYTITRPSGNAVFDAKVRSTMDALIGQELPPPPPLYPDILGTTVQPRLSGSGAKCDN
jgi:outer membrane biosynthesis protein TonB